MEFSELIRYRESVRSYDPERQVEDKILDRVLEAGRIAPSASNRQPWKFVLVSSEEMLAKVKACYLRPWFQDAPHILVLVSNIKESWIRSYDGYNSIEIDAAIAMDHMILAATNEGLGTCWIAAFNPDILKKALSLKDHEVVFAITPLGYPRSDYIRTKGKNRKDFKDVVLKV
jgi:nitroreductase